jgi:hypothetical protein
MTITFDGTNGITTPAILNANGDGIGNIGAAALRFNTVFAKATSAQYADLAECYVGDASYPAGTVVKFGGTNEITIADQDHDSTIAGVVTTNPAYTMNTGLVANHVVTIALCGRVPCQVEGLVKKGDLLVSAGNGRARTETAPAPGTIIGKAVQSFTGDTGVIEVAVGIR